MPGSHRGPATATVAFGHSGGVVRPPWASSVMSRDLLGSSMEVPGSAASGREQLASRRRRAGARRLRGGAALCFDRWRSRVGGAPPVWVVLGVLGSGVDPSNPRYWESRRGCYSDASPGLLGRSF